MPLKSNEAFTLKDERAEGLLNHFVTNTTPLPYQRVYDIPYICIMLEVSTGSILHSPVILVVFSEKRIGSTTAPIRLDTNFVILSECWSAWLAASSIDFQTRRE